MNSVWPNYPHTHTHTHTHVHAHTIDYSTHTVPCTLQCFYNPWAIYLWKCRLKQMLSWIDATSEQHKCALSGNCLKTLTGSKMHRTAVRTCLSVQFRVPSFILVTFCQFLFATSCQVSCLGDYMLHPNVLHLCLIFLSVPRAFELCFPSEPHHRHDCVIAPVSFPRVIFVNFCLIFGTLCFDCLSISTPSIRLNPTLNFCSPYLSCLHKFIPFVSFLLFLYKQKWELQWSSVEACCCYQLPSQSTVPPAITARCPIGGAANWSSLLNRWF